MNNGLEELITQECEDIQQMHAIPRQIILFAKGIERGHERLTPGQLFRTGTMRELHQDIELIHDALYRKKPMYILGQTTVHIAQAITVAGVVYGIAQYLIT